MVLTKSHYWKYEEEIRAVSINYQGLVDIKPKCIQEIIFGYKSVDSFVREIIDIVRKDYSHIDAYTRMKLDSDNFGLKVYSPLNISH